MHVANLSHNFSQISATSQVTELKQWALIFVYMFRYKMGFVFLLFIVQKELGYSFEMKVKTIINCDFSQVAMLSLVLSKQLYC